LPLIADFAVAVKVVGEMLTTGPGGRNDHERVGVWDAGTVSRIYG